MPYTNLNDCKNLTKIKLYKNKCEIWIRKKKKKTAIVCLSFSHYVREVGHISNIQGQWSLHS